MLSRRVVYVLCAVLFAIILVATSDNTKGNSTALAGCAGYSAGCAGSVDAGCAGSAGLFANQPVRRIVAIPIRATGKVVQRTKSRVQSFRTRSFTRMKNRSCSGR